MEITEKEFWEKYWGEIKLPQRVNLHFKNDKVISETINTFVPLGDETKLALEVGCAPGKWMQHVYESLNYNVDGFEYVEIAAEKTVENLHMCKVSENRFNVFTRDFLSVVPEPKYDLVVSLGFIEHFDNYEEIFKKHLDYMKSGAYAVVGFPSFRGLNYYVQLLIDKITGSKIINNHNIAMMDKDLMQAMLEKQGVKTVYISYIGGFESALFNTGDIKNPLLRFTFKITLKFLALTFPKIKNRFISSYLIFVVEK